MQKRRLGDSNLEVSALGIVPIPGTRKLERLDENLGAAAVELTPEELREVDSAATKIAVQGARYPEPLERLTGR